MRLPCEETLFRSGIGRWLRVAFDDVASAITSVVRPWTDLHAVKTTQVDVVQAMARQQSDLAQAIASVEALGRELAQMKARVAEQEAMLRELQARGGSPVGPSPGGDASSGKAGAGADTASRW